MQNLKFRYISAKNFMCFGPEGVEIFFSDLGNVVLIKGINLDTGADCSNASGKSSVADAVSYCLYGKTVKKPKKLDHSTLINSITKKKLEVIVDLGDYRILRGREPDKLRIWHSPDHIWDKNTDITPGGKGEAQKIIDKLVGLSHLAFCSVAVFDDSNSYTFLELDAAGKRAVVENLLGLDRYKDHHEKAKEMFKEEKSHIKNLTTEYESISREIDSHDKHITKIVIQQETWERNKNLDLADLQKRIDKKSLKLTDSGQGQHQKKINELTTSLETINNKQTKIESAIKEARDKLEEGRAGREVIRGQAHDYNVEVRRLNTDMQKSLQLIKSLEDLEEGAACPTCHGEISKKNYHNVLQHERNTVISLQNRINRENIKLHEENGKLEKRIAFLAKLEEHLGTAQNTLKTVADFKNKQKVELAALEKAPKPELRVLEMEISELKKQVMDKKTEESPYKDILSSAKQEKGNKEEEKGQKAREIEKTETELPYLAFWIEAFGDKGLRKYVIDDIIPYLNARTFYWLQHLIDSKIEITFDNELEETILVNGLESYYHGMSAGEKRRINLAVSQAFAHVMMLSAGTCPSLVFLDEITGGCIDRAGVTGIYNMIFELAKERQVLVTTHNDTLLQMLQGCAEITVVKKDGITRINN